MSGPILGALSSNRWLEGTIKPYHKLIGFTLGRSLEFQSLVEYMDKTVGEKKASNWDDI